MGCAKSRLQEVPTSTVFPIRCHSSPKTPAQQRNVAAVTANKRACMTSGSSLQRSVDSFSREEPFGTRLGFEENDNRAFFERYKDPTYEIAKTNVTT